jgi:hypothetical protein
LVFQGVLSELVLLKEEIRQNLNKHQHFSCFSIDSALYNVAIETPLNIKRAPIAIYHDKAPEKNSGKNNDRTNAKNTDQNEYVTFKQSPLVAPILSIAVYQHRKETIPTKAVKAKRTQHGV